MGQLGQPTNPLLIDLFNGNGTATGTRAENPNGNFGLPLPYGAKAIAVTLVTSATLTLKIQNSGDKQTWFDVSSSTVSTAGAQGSFVADIAPTAIPWWRVNITAHTTSGTGNVMYATLIQATV